MLKTEHLRNAAKMWFCCKVISVNQYTSSVQPEKEASDISIALNWC